MSVSTDSNSTQLLISVINQEILTCEVCHGRMALIPESRTPKCLDCSHCFCFSCLDKLKAGLGIFTSIVCPVCETETTIGIGGVSVLNNNKSVMSLINILEAFGDVLCRICLKRQANFRCRDCPDSISCFCSTCHTSVHQVGEGSNHIVDEIGSFLPTLNPPVPMVSPRPVNPTDNEVIIVYCPRHLIGRVIGSSNVINSIQVEAKCFIEFRRLSDKDVPAQIAVKGSHQNVKKARVLLESFIRSLETVTSTDGNETKAVEKAEGEDPDVILDINEYDAIDLFELRSLEINKLSSDTGCQLRLIQNPSSSKPAVRISGGNNPRAKQFARDVICRMLSSCSDNLTVSSDSVSLASSNSQTNPVEAQSMNAAGAVIERILLPKELYFKIASSGFVQITAIAERTGCVISINDEEGVGFVATFEGSKFQVEEAKRQCFQTFTRRPSASANQLAGNENDLQNKKANSFGGKTSGMTPERKDFERIIVACLKCELETVGRLIGVKGSRIMELRNLTQCKISIHKGGGVVPCTVEVRGTEVNVNAAMPFVKMVLNGGGAAMNRIREMFSKTSAPPPVPPANPIYNPQNPQYSSHPQQGNYETKVPNSSLWDKFNQQQFSPRSMLAPSYDPEHIYSGGYEFGSSINEYSEGRTDRIKQSQYTDAHAFARAPTIDEVITGYGSSVSDLSEAYSSYEQSFSESRHNVSLDSESSNYDDISIETVSTIPMSLLTTVSHYFLPPPDADANFVELIDSSYADVSTLILNQGAAIREIMEKTGCKISIEQAPSTNAFQIRIQGTTDQREFAKMMVHLKLQGAHSSGYSNASKPQILKQEMQCLSKAVSMIIGSEGSTIRHIQGLSMTKIFFNNNVNILGKYTIVVIIGTEEGINIAVREINQILSSFSSPQSIEILTPIASPVTTPGRKSRNAIQQIRGESDPPHMMSGRGQPQNMMMKDNTGASIAPRLNYGGRNPPDFYIPVPNQPMKKYQNQSPYQSDSASSYSDDRGGDMYDPDSPRLSEATITCESHQLAQIIGKRGSILRELKRLSGCEIHVDPRPENAPPLPPDASSLQTIHLQGTDEQIENAKNLLQSVIELGAVKALGMETKFMDCPESKVPLVIGIKGLTSKEMMRRTGCKIHVNEAVTTGGCCRIELTGTSVQVEQAQELINLVLEHGTKALGKRFKKLQPQGEFIQSN